MTYHTVRCGANKSSKRMQDELVPSIAIDKILYLPERNLSTRLIMYTR